jgi:hypothetical protein
MYDVDKRPIGAVAEDAYEMLLEAIDPEEGLSRSNAHARLVESGFAEADAKYALDRLLNRGYLYAVEGQLFITDREHGE